MSPSAQPQSSKFCTEIITLPLPVEPLDLLLKRMILIRSARADVASALALAACLRGPGGRARGPQAQQLMVITAHTNFSKQPPH